MVTARPRASNPPPAGWLRSGSQKSATYKKSTSGATKPPLITAGAFLRTATACVSTEIYKTDCRLLRLDGNAMSVARAWRRANGRRLRRSRRSSVRKKVILPSTDGLFFDIIHSINFTQKGVMIHRRAENSAFVQRRREHVGRGARGGRLSRIGAEGAKPAC